MKISDVKATILKYTYENGIADAQNFFSARCAVIVQVETDEGIVGLDLSALRTINRIVLPRWKNW